jgi:hypothetical protein
MLCLGAAHTWHPGTRIWSQVFCDSTAREQGGGVQDENHVSMLLYGCAELGVLTVPRLDHLLGQLCNLASSDTPVPRLRPDTLWSVREATRSVAGLSIAAPGSTHDANSAPQGSTGAPTGAQPGIAAGSVADAEQGVSALVLAHLQGHLQAPCQSLVRAAHLHARRPDLRQLDRTHAPQGALSPEHLCMPVHVSVFYDTLSLLAPWVCASAARGA